MTICIYKLTFENGHSYIGQTSNFHKRLYSHLQTRGLGSPKLRFAFENYGTPTISILEECSLEELNEKELKYISILQPELNTRAGGSSMAGLDAPRSKYTKEQLEEVLNLFMTTPLKYSEIAILTGVASGTVHDVVKRRSHTWLTQDIPDYLFENACDVRSKKCYTFYTNDGIKHEVTDTLKFEQEHNLPANTISTFLSRNIKDINSYGMSRNPIRQVELTFPDNSTKVMTEFEAGNILNEVSKYAKNQVMKKNKPSKGYSLKFLNTLQRHNFQN